MNNRRTYSKKSQRNVLLAIGGCLLFILSFLFIFSIIIGGLYIYLRNDGELLSVLSIPESNQTPQSIVPTATVPSALAAVSSPTPNLSDGLIPNINHASTQPPPMPPPVSKIALNPPSALNQGVVPDRAYSDLQQLLELNIPEHDYFNVFKSLKGDPGLRTYQRLEFNLGDRQVFYTDQGRTEATLMAVTENAYFWVDDALSLDEADMRDAGIYFESNQYFGQFSHLFGRPWDPGMDNDPRFSILHLSGSNDDYEIGYFSDVDEYPNTLPLFQESNQQEIIYLNMDQLQFGSDLYYGTLIHELQHLSQWNLDKNESVWLNEGFSQLAEHYVGLDTAIPDPYLEQPDTRLDSWAYEDDVIDAHYANSFLFAVYLWEQLTDSAMFELIREPANGLSSVQKILKGHAPDRSLEQFLADWAAANFLDDPSAGSQYFYNSLEIPDPTIEARLSEFPFSQVFDLDQMAVHYLELDRSGTLSLAFAGDTSSNLIDSPPTSGEQMWFTRPDNDSHTTLTAAFDLTGLQQATLFFNTWFDLDENFDFAYITISDDQGQTWDVLPSQFSVDGDYGPAYTGNSSQISNNPSGWVAEQISLDDYTGKVIMVSFQVMTEFEDVGKGFALDDIMIPELGFSTDVEQENSIWLADGFVKTGWQLPQLWSLQLIKLGNPPILETLELDELNHYQGQIELGSEGGVLIVMPMNPFSDDKARYWVQAGS